MQIDKITFNDISIFHQEEEFSIFHKLNFTKTIGGKEWLRRFFTEPHHDLKRIIGTQNIIKTLLNHPKEMAPARKKQETRANTEPRQELTVQQNLYFGYYFRVQYKSDLLELIDIFSRLEAWYSMAKAVKTYGLHFPKFIEQEDPFFKA